jgi:hypothetical protein
VPHGATVGEAIVQEHPQPDAVGDDDGRQAGDEADGSDAPDGPMRMRDTRPKAT